jgi:hypothetical protein
MSAVLNNAVLIDVSATTKINGAVWWWATVRLLNAVMQ